MPNYDGVFRSHSAVGKRKRVGSFITGSTTKQPRVSTVLQPQFSITKSTQEDAAAFAEIFSPAAILLSCFFFMRGQLSFENEQPLDKLLHVGSGTIVVQSNETVLKIFADPDECSAEAERTQKAYNATAGKGTVSCEGTEIVAINGLNLNALRIKPVGLCLRTFIFQNICTCNELDADTLVTKFLKQSLATTVLLYRNEIIHGDQKPENYIMVADADQNTEFVLIDFGSMSAVGTLLYMAAERQEALVEGNTGFSLVKQLRHDVESITFIAYEIHRFSSQVVQCLTCDSGGLPWAATKPDNHTELVIAKKQLLQQITEDTDSSLHLLAMWLTNELDLGMLETWFQSLPDKVIPYSSLLPQE